MPDHSKILSDVLYEFAFAMRKPVIAILEDFIRLYPHHADALTEFAIELALDSALDTELAEEFESVETEPGSISLIVSRAISHFHKVASELKKDE